MRRPCKRSPFWTRPPSSEVDSGMTSPLAAVPIASTTRLMLARPLPPAWRHRKAAYALILATTLTACTINAGAIAAETTVVSSDRLVRRTDRTMQFNPAVLVWNIKQAASIQMEQARPAEVYVLPLTDLGFPQGAESVTVTGAVTDALLKDGTLRFSTPGDTGVDQQAQFHLTRAGATTTLDLLIRTELPTAVATYVESLDDGSLPLAAPRLIIGGLGANNILRPGTLTFRLEGTSAMDLKDDSDGLIMGPGNIPVSLKPYWTFNPADGSFSISAAALTQLLAALPPGALNVSLNFVSKDGAFAASYELIAIKAGAKMIGKLIDSQGADVTSLAGRTILLRGYHSHLRTASTIDAKGGFTFNDVIPDTYQVTLSDLNNPNVVSVSALVFNNSTEVYVTLAYTSGSAKLKSFAQSSSTSGKAKQNGAAPVSRNRPGSDQASKPKAALAAGDTRLPSQ